MNSSIKRLAARGAVLLNRAAASGSQLRLAPARARRRGRALAEAGRGKPVTLFLAPDAGIAPFYASHALLARSLSDAGRTALLLSCSGLQPICSVKFARQMKPTAPGDARNPACAQCRANALRAGHEYELADIPLEGLIGEPQRAEIEAVLSANADAPWASTYDGIEIGAACLGETFRAQRKTSIDELDAEDRALLRALLWSTLAIYLAVKLLASRFKLERIVYFGDYAYFLPPQVFAKRNGIALTHVSHAYNGDIDRRYVVLWPGHGVTHMLSQVERWPDNRDIPITPSLVEKIAEGALFRLRGHGGASTYSPNWTPAAGDLIAKLGLPPGGKVLVAYTNSTDELICNRQFMRVLGLPPFENAPNPFPSQLAWLRALVDWVSARPGLRLVLRLHPRMAIGHRHATVASEYAQIQAALGRLPANVAVVAPESDLSSYNLAEFADAALTAWSSIGLELARFGVPVVAAFQKIGPFPKSPFINFEATPEEYFAAVEAALERRPSLQTIVQAFRWTHFLHWTSLVDVSDIVPSADYPDIPPYGVPRNRDTILRVLAQGADPVALNMERLRRGGEAAQLEEQAVVKAVERFIRFFMTGRSEDSARLRVASPASEAPSGAGALVTLEGRDVLSFVENGERVRRYSLLAARLAMALVSEEAPIGA